MTSSVQCPHCGKYSNGIDICPYCGNSKDGESIDTYSEDE